MKIDGFLPIIAPLFYLILLESIFFVLKIFFKTPLSLIFTIALVLLVMILLLVFSVYRILKLGQQKWTCFGPYLLPLYLSLSVVMICFLLPIRDLGDRLIIHLILAISALIIHFYFRLLYDRYINTARYRKHSLTYISSYANFIAIYLIASSAFGLQTFLNISTSLGIMIISLAVLASTYQSMWANSIPFKPSLFYVVIICLLIFELSWSVSFLTLSFYILGLLIAIVYYVLAGLARFQINKELNKTIIKTYLSLGVISLFAVLLTARWF